MTLMTGGATVLGVLALAAVAGAAACDGPTAPDDGSRVRTGVWGGESVRLDVTDSGGTVEYDCAHGTINDAMTLDERNRFALSGWHVQESGGPIADGELPRRAASYRGQVDGDIMTLTVTFTDGTPSLGPFTLTYGKAGRLRKCL